MNPVSLKVHNQAVHSSLEKGDIVRFPRGIYDHFGIYNGGGKIIHMDKDKENKIIVREDEFDKVCKNSKAEKCNYLDDICRQVKN
ncbi:hypothetical protein CHS0354_028077 [Potamilus streckersoni]|uniref:LRAT domain-containing protein n=1 Tax=Potamilus streckersoni TaxID=2493646 RepID=A0AAE0THW2_9BIVA|nr:hypothetical protein CHS0354_028077 [Potamilus streckersoni]